MELNVCIVFYLFTILMVTCADNINEEDDMEKDTKILSRRKRFLVFPDGSSFQLVFCTQDRGSLHIGDILIFGSTAALAWELPTDPTLFHLFKKHDKLTNSAQRRKDEIIFLDEDGKVLSKMPYKRKFVANPAFAKRSLSEDQAKPVPVKEMHDIHKRRNLLADLDDNSTEFHRDGRKSLYDKVVTLFEGLGYDGKECVLRMICESGKLRHKQGTFFDEIIKATFTFPKSKKLLDKYQEFGFAYNANEDCANIYPKCENLDRLEV